MNRFFKVSEINEKEFKKNTDTTMAGEDELHIAVKKPDCIELYVGLEDEMNKGFLVPLDAFDESAFEE